MQALNKISVQIFLFQLSCLLTCSPDIYAQTRPVKSFGLLDENKRIQVNVIFKNKTGYIFAGTNNGLYKFDGIKFYPIHFANKNYSDTVTAIFQDRTDTYWVGFASGRIAQVSNGRLAYLDLEEGYATEKITAFLEDRQGNIWFATSGEGLYYFKNKRLYLLNEDDGLPDNHITALALAGNGDVLAASDQGLVCIDAQNKKVISVIGPPQGLPDYIVTSIASAGKESFWIGMQDKGFCLYNHTSKTVTVPVKESWSFGQVNTLLLAQSGLYIGTQYDGLLLYNPDTNDLNSVKKITTTPAINTLIQDNQGNIWASSSEMGLVRTPGNELNFLPLPEGIVFDHIHAILADKSGNIWVTNSNNELIKKSYKGKNKTQKVGLSGVTEKTDITSLHQDAYNNIWIGTVGKGLYVLNPVTLRYRTFFNNPFFRDATILSITGKNKTIFLSTLQGSMAVDLQPSNVNIQNDYTFRNFDNVGITSNYIHTIFQDSRNRIWFATDGRGLSVIDKGNFTNYHSQDQIKDDRIYSITEDLAGNIWFSTASAGIYKFDGHKFSNYTLKEGLSNLNISAVKTDSRGNIVIIHKNGLDILEPRSGKISYININKGITQLNVEDLGAVAQDAAGNIYASSPENIVVYSPGEAVQQPETILESVQLFLNDLTDYSVRTFSYDDNNFTFNYTGLYYTDPEQVYYQYKLEGFDSTWIITKDRSKTFPKLAPGKYIFRIQSALNKSFTRADEASFAFEIKQAFYKEWWFITGGLILFGLLLFAYIRNRESSLKKMQRLQQEKTEFRFEVLRNQVNPHFLFNSFNTLISTIEDDPKLAVEYVEQLSDFFRKIVNYRDREIITLREELELLNTYYFLQKKRFGDNLMLETNLSEETELNNFVPPLTLQLLIENAIKHNAITKETPLHISIEKENEEYLSVANNINSRLSKETGSGLGLQNIINRYRLLTNKDVKVLESPQRFKVSLPFIKIRHV